MRQSRFRLQEPPFADRTGAGVRVAVIDSGIALPHPHIGAVAGGASVGIDPAGDAIRVVRGAFTDRIGHGTAVAAAIQEKAPDAELVAVKVFDLRLTTSAAVLAHAITVAAESGARLINLSLGTDNADHALELEEAAHRAAAQGAVVVAALESSGRPCYPGSLAGVVGVRHDPECARDEICLEAHGPGVVLVASPLPRPIPGVPVERNLHGISFAVANVTGFLARLVEGADEETRTEIFGLLGTA